jgi:uncharacterized membrane protein YdbT with pleckstrin-like domain
MSWREPLLRLMRVPHSPTEPPGSPPRVFRAAPNFFKLRLIRWVFTTLFAVFGLVGAIYFAGSQIAPRVPPFVVWMIRVGEVFGTIALIFEVTVGWVLVRLDFELRWYMLSDRAIRIREGITTVREKTIALANIQNIAIKQGPLQRWLGIADVEVNTAGGGGGATEIEKKNAKTEPLHVAYFRGVDNAEEIRDLLREGVRRQRDAGLGDPDEIERPAGDDVREAVTMLLAEARALRAAL